MDRSDVLFLIGETRTQDENGIWSSEPHCHEVFCDVQSITRAEWFEAGRNGIKPDFTFIINRNEYHGEEIVEYEGRRYGVYRTFVGRGESMELYVERKGGLVQNEQ